MATTEEIKTLREKTGISVMQCKKALEEAGGDMDKALIILTKKSGDIVSKKSDRELGAGVIKAYIHGGGTVGAMVELDSETDFVAKHEDFGKLAYDIAMHIAAQKPTYLSREDVKDEDLVKAKEVFQEEVKDKPEEMQEKILEGKIDSYLKERILLEQPFIKDMEKTVGDLVSEATQKFGEKVKIARYECFTVLGE
ncbi:MAG: elongation factor Ts [Candidatus Campbellbacteria bacterium]|nr:elongation factor Ts [Candidatus Campbellbacteria bacterium]